MITEVDEQVDESAAARSRPPSAPRKRPSLTGRAAILAMVSAILLVALAVPVRSWFAQRAQVAQLRSDVEAARERVAALKVEAERWNDPNFVAAEARRRLHYVLPGEVGYITMGGVTDPQATGDAVVAEQPWFTSLLGSVESADGAVPATAGSNATTPRLGPKRVGKTGTRDSAQ